MKTFYLTTLLLSLSIASSAQTQKGALNINGQFGSNSGGQHSNISNGLIKSFSIELNPNVGFFVKDNWEVGAGVLFGITRSRMSGYIIKGTANKFGIQSYSKYYIGKRSVRPYVILEASHTWISEKTKFVNGNTQGYTSANWNAGGGAGVAWFVTPKIGLFSQLTYNRDLERQIKYSTGTLNLNFGVQVNLGKKK
ncbi:outer membrane beta-barrel protein [Lacibacter sediminis]|uniref:Outer membrane beta-barrel protein n=1 Tax=Lacibacter sediminis TaxID=2760713 RepID=A0A7G5XGU9_9BACT|nr:outer membrane beta-barrel protein [Lacibacter sediminis]QNA44702.1 outer membrane beta-barrel protein [Lacibacter sediminis]